MNYKENLIKPVLFMVFNRPEKTYRVWAEIRKAKPQKLYISADGPRDLFPDDRDKCAQVKKIINDVDWECDVKKLFHSKNLGCTLAGKTAFDWVFSQEVEMIELEDDVVPTQSFFWFMQEMLEKYKDDKRICYVCAENYGIKSGNNTYFFSKFGGAWGWATWKRVYDLWEYKLESLKEIINTTAFRNTFLSKFEYDFWKRKFLYWKYIGGNTYDLQTVYLIHKYDMLNIVPNINLISNIGWDSEASNTKANNTNNPLAKKFGNVPSYELNIINHPQYVKSSDKEMGNQWFKYHFQLERTEFEWRLLWALNPILKQLKLILGPIYRKYLKK